MVDFDGCPCSGKSLAKLIRPLILAALSRRAMHGYELKREMAEAVFSGGGVPDLSGIYRCLNDMEKLGLVASTWSADHAGPARRRYSLTEGGTACLAQWKASLADFRHQLDETIAYLNTPAP